MTELIQLFKDKGLGFILAIGSFYLLYKVIMFLLTKMTSVQEELVSSLKEHTESIKSYRNDQIIVNGHNKREHEQILKQAEETTKILGRINGYKDN